MTTDAQRQVILNKTTDLIGRAAGDDKGAFDYLAIIFFTSRVIDDIVDGDREVDNKAYFNCVQELLVNLHMNKFFRENYDMLVSQHVTIWNTWLRANDFEKSDDLVDRLHARTLRLYIDELLPLVAYLTQGYDKMKEIERELRVFTAWYHRMDPPDVDLEEVNKCL